MLKLLCLSGAILGFIGVAAGSFGAHGLKDLLEANGQAANWETAVRYCLFHAVVMVAMAGLSGAEGSTSLLTAAAACFLVGVLIFSGFLGVLALTGLRWLGAIVPIGGLLLLVGWTLLAAAIWRMRF